MSKAKIIALIGLIAFAFSMTAIGNAVAGERHKGLSVKHSVKWNQTEVGDEEGHVLAHYEAKAVTGNKGGKWFLDKWPEWECGILDINIKTGVGSGHGYGTDTDKDGDKMFYKWEGKLGEGTWKGEWMLIKGTGKFAGVKGKGPFVAYPLPEGQWYVDWEMEVELPGR